VIAQLHERERVTFAMQFGEQPLEMEVDRAQFIAAAEPHYAELQRLVQGARVAGMAIELRVSQRVAALPGLLERLKTLRDRSVAGLPQGAAALRVSQRVGALPGLLERRKTRRDCSIAVLPQGAAALGALQFESAIVRA